MSYCAGQAGIEAQTASSAQSLLSADPAIAASKKNIADVPIISLSDDRIFKALASSKEGKRKERTGLEAEEGDGSKRRKFNAGVNDEDMGI